MTRDELKKSIIQKEKEEVNEERKKLKNERRKYPERLKKIFDKLDDRIIRASRVYDKTRLLITGVEGEGCVLQILTVRLDLSDFDRLIYNELKKRYPDFKVYCEGRNIYLDWSNNKQV